MQIKCPHRKFCRLDAVRDELSPQAAERFDSLALFDQLRLEGATEATALKAAGCSRATPCRWKRRLREQGAPAPWPAAARAGCGGASGPSPSSSWCAKRAFAFRCGDAPRSAPCWRASAASRPASPPPGA